MVHFEMIFESKQNFAVVPTENSQIGDFSRAHTIRQ